MIPLGKAPFVAHSLGCCKSPFPPVLMALLICRTDRIAILILALHNATRFSCAPIQARLHCRLLHVSQRGYFGRNLRDSCNRPLSRARFEYWEQHSEVRHSSGSSRDARNTVSTSTTSSGSWTW
jgi:hypothetical protein